MNIIYVVIIMIQKSSEKGNKQNSLRYFGRMIRCETVDVLRKIVTVTMPATY